ncbi:MAG: hypothetical protein HOD92_14495 [Deltaproteobacteria bacterium]|jgi:hypothetical protein|nr:hypothetical protein [Deltaproteobacteria bacterium]
MKTINFLTYLVLMLILPFSLLLAESVGTLTVNKGIVKIQRNLMHTVHQELGVEISIHEGDEIQTGHNSRAFILYQKKGGETEIYSSTIFIIKEIGEETDFFTLPIGKIRFVVPKLKKKLKKVKHRLRLTTANAIIGVKGTEGIVSFANGETTLLSVDDTVTIANIAEPDIEVKVPEKQASKVVGLDKPIPPVEIPETLIQKVIISDTMEDSTEIQFNDDIEQKEKTESEKTSQAEEEEEDDDEEEDDEIIEEAVADIEDIEEELDEASDQSKTYDFTIENP